MVVWPADDHDKSGMWICKNTRTAKGLTVKMIYMSAVVSNAVAAEQAEFAAEWSALCPQRRRRRRRLTLSTSEKSCNFENQINLFRHMHTPCSGHTCLFLVGNRSGNVFYVSSIFNFVQMSHLVA